MSVATFRTKYPLCNSPELIHDQDILLKSIPHDRIPLSKIVELVREIDCSRSVYFVYSDGVISYIFKTIQR